MAILGRMPGTLLALVLTLPVPAPQATATSEPPSRALSRVLTAAPRLAGTQGSRDAAERVAELLAAAGWEAEIQSHAVWLSLPRRLAWSLSDPRLPEPAVLAREARFDPDATPCGDVPPFNAWSAEGAVEGPVVDVGRGLADDWTALVEAGIDLRGTIALARYGGAFRGVKPELAAAHGCAGMLLFSDPAEDGAEKGPTWPEGPWKPGDAVQRGSIYPIARAPGDPSTPGWASPAPGEQGRRLAPAEWRAGMPSIPCLPIGADDAARVLAMLDEGGPGPGRVALAIEQPPELRAVHNVIARLEGSGPELVVAGNHRDAWVRGAQDAASGTVTLLRAAQRLGERARGGWMPRATIVLGFWDGEEFGLVGSTEWGEANAGRLREHGVAYVNADAVVSGTQFGASGSSGLLPLLRRVLERVPAPAPPAGKETDDDGPAEAPGPSASLWDQWVRSSGEEGPRLDLPGSGSDYTVFLHHLGLPVLDLSFGGQGGGGYHTAFDDFELMDRFLDPGWAGHETAGLLIAELLAELADVGRGAFEPAVEAAELARVAAELAAEPSIGSGRAEELSAAFLALGRRWDLRKAAGLPVADGADFYGSFLLPDGLPDRPWYRNPLWAPGLDTGYAARSFPLLRAAAEKGEEALDAALEALEARLEALAPAPPESGAGADVRARDSAQPGDS